MKFVLSSIRRPCLCFLTCLVFLPLASCRPYLPPTDKPAPHSHPVNSPLEIGQPPVPVSSPTNKPSSPNTSETPDPIGDVLSADLTPGETTSRLLSLLSSTPADDKSFLVQIAGNYCPDEEYWRLLPLLLDRSQPEDVRDELMRDVCAGLIPLGSAPSTDSPSIPPTPSAPRPASTSFPTCRTYPKMTSTLLAGQSTKRKRKNPKESDSAGGHLERATLNRTSV